MALVRKILEATIPSGGSSAIFTDSDIPNSLIRVYSTNSNIYPQNISLTGNTLTVSYETVTSALGVAVELVKQGLEIDDNLTSDNTDHALSAKQGKVLKGLIDAIPAGITELSELDDVEITDIEDGQVLAWDEVEEKFINVDQSGGSDENIIYSYTPVKVGKWLDDRDVYRCVYDLGSDITISNTSFVNTSIDTSSMGILIDVKAIYSTGITVYNVMGNINNGILRLQADRNDSPIACRYVIVLYVEGA